MNYKIRINEVNKEDSKTKAYATVVFGDSLVVRNIAIVERKDGNGVFVSMPAYKASNKAKGGESAYHDIVYPITKEFREQLYGEMPNTYHEKKQEKAHAVKDAVKSESRSLQERIEDTPFR